MMLDHHAFLCRLKEVDFVNIAEFLATLEVEEIDRQTFFNFTIGESRNLIEAAYKRPQTGNKKVIAVCLHNITIEAQQALLKILEEPPRSTVFVFAVPEGLYLLPTLLSRFQRVDSVGSTERAKDNVTFREFAAMSISDRISEISSRTTTKDNDWISDIKRGLIEVLANEKPIKRSKNTEVLLWIAKHIQTRGASNKLLLEELALSL